MSLLAWVAAAVAAALLVSAASLAALFVRRGVLQREGGFDMCLSEGRHEGWSGGWIFGVGLVRDEQIDWYRTFTISLRPKRVLHRAGLIVLSRREPDAEELYELPRGHVIFVCATDDAPVEISMSESSATAFLAWREGAPPGGRLVG